MTLKNIPKKRRSNLAALIAIVIVSMVASVPAVVTSLEGGIAPTYAALHHGDADFDVAANGAANP